MHSKSILLGGILGFLFLVIIVWGITYLRQTQYENSVAAEHDRILESYRKNLVEEMKEGPWETYQNELFSFQYPANWRFSERIGSIGITASSQVTSPLIDIEGERREVTGHAYGILISIKDVNFYRSNNPAYENREIHNQALDDVIATQDIGKIIQVWTGLSNDPHQVITINDSEGLLYLYKSKEGLATNRKDVFSGGQLTFIKKDKFIEISFYEALEPPMNDVIKASDSLLEAIKDTPYGLIIETFKINK